MKKTRSIAEIKRLLTAKEKPETPLNPRDMLSIGATPLNLACSGLPRHAIPKGKYVLFVGDSASGKTFVCLTLFAEASITKRFAGYRLIFDAPEDGALMDMHKFFGPRMAAKLEPPQRDDDGEPLYSETIEDFYYNLDDALDRGPCIYVLDSIDVLTSRAEDEKFNEDKAAHRKGKETSGSYGDGKAKKNSGLLRKALRNLRKTGSILVIINQTRDNLGFGFEKKTRSGGRALRFYATLELWSSIKEKLKKTVNGVPRQIGIISKIEIKKNRLTGRETSVEIPLLRSTGIDDVGACIRYLINEKHWKGTKEMVTAPEFNFKGKQERLIRKIEDEDRERELQDLVAAVWRGIEAACNVKRKSRYE